LDKGGRECSEHLRLVIGYMIREQTQKGLPQRCPSPLCSTFTRRVETNPSQSQPQHKLRKQQDQTLICTYLDVFCLVGKSKQTQRKPKPSLRRISKTRTICHMDCVTAAGTKIIENDIRIGSRSMLPTGLGTTSTCNLRLQEDVNSLHVLSLDVDFLLSLVDLFVK